MVEREASDLHLAAGSPPVIRVNGRLHRLPDREKLMPDVTRDLIYRILSTEQQKLLETRRQLDFSYTIPGLARFRVNAYFQREAIGGAFRLIPAQIKSLEQLAMPPRLYELADKPRGLVLVTGPTGSGKSTTLASLLDHINGTRHEHILTIEDPIEFLHWHRSCIVNQREIGPDATSFAEALRSALRQDPDVILVGEMRDLETIGTALTAAETGHLVFATLHTQSAPQTIDRIIDVFSPEQQQQVRVQLSVALQGVVTQTLLPTSDGAGRIAACEVLIPTPAVRNLIREGKTHQIYSTIQTGGAHGMQTIDAALADLVRRSTITREMAESRSGSPEEFRRLMKVKADDLVIASRQLATMVQSGMSLLRALYVIEEQTESDKQRETFDEVRKDVEAGLALSDALKRHPDVFNELYVAMVQAGETGGILDHTLVRVATQLEKDAALRRQIKAAMIYPALIGGFALIVLVALVAFLVPVFEKIFDDFGGELPAITKFTVWLSHMMTGRWYVMIAIVAGMGWLFRFREKSGPGEGH